MYAPVGGEVTEVNESLVENPGLVNESAIEEGWFMKLKIADAGELDGLMGEDAYQKFLETQS